MTTNFSSYVGRRDAEHVRRFTSAAVAARAASPRKCEAINSSDGCRCRLLALKGFHLCQKHASLSDFVHHIDPRVRPTLERLANGLSQCKAKAARARLAAMDKRQTFWQWTLDPRTPGETVKFANPYDRQRCEAWLHRNGLAIDERSEVSGEMPTALCVDRSLWAALRFVVKGNIPESRAIHSARWAHLMDGRFYKRLRKKLAECVDVSAD